MCLIAFAWRAHDEWPLVVAANRDEFFARPTTSAAWSDDGLQLSGRDLRGGGTWMGVSRDSPRHGRFAALTNVRDPARQRSDVPSRGELVDRFLVSSDPDATLAAIADERPRFNGFNLLTARWTDDAGRMSVLTHPGHDAVETIAPGIHGLSNASLDTPWPKVGASTSALAYALTTSRDTDELVERAMTLLADRRIAPDDALPSTGVSLDAERALSAAFIRMPGYGTRSSTVFVVDRDGRALFVERRTEPGVHEDERRFAFETAAPPRLVSAVRAS